MSNTVDCSSMFALPNADEVNIVTVKSGFEVKHGEQLIWRSSSFAMCERMMKNYIETGV